MRQLKDNQSYKAAYFVSTFFQTYTCSLLPLNPVPAIHLPLLQITLNSLLSIYHEKTWYVKLENFLIYMNYRGCDGVRCIYIYKCSQCTVYFRVQGMLYNLHLMIVHKHSILYALRLCFLPSSCNYCLHNSFLHVSHSFISSLFYFSASTSTYLSLIRLLLVFLPPIFLS